MPMPGVTAEVYPQIAKRLGISVPHVWDLASYDDEVATTLSIRQAYELSLLTGVAIENLIGCEARDAANRIDVSDFCTVVRCHISTTYSGISAFEDAIGWRVEEFLVDPNRLYDVVNWDCLQDVASSVGIDPFNVLPRPNTKANKNARQPAITSLVESEIDPPVPPHLTFANKMKASRKFKLGISNLKQFCSKTVALTLALISGTSISSLQLKAENEPSAVSGAKSQPVADYSDPIKTYRFFLEAIKRDDLAAAKACCTISDDNKSGSLDVLVGMWVTFHRFNKVALLNFKEETSPYLRDGADNEDNPYLRDDCTDKALDRTISRLAGSKMKIEGDRAKVTIKWEDDDGYPNQAFFYSEEDRIFRKTKGLWKLDILPEGSPDVLIDLFKPGSWACGFRDGMNLLNVAIEEIESGKLKTWQQVTEELEKRTKVLEQKWVRDHHESHIQSKDEQPTKGNNSTTTPK